MEPQQKLGHYEIQSRLGSGGMGEVYLARDTRLNRLVAIKTLLPSFAADEGRLKRFLQEAKVTSALNHPNIGHLYEIGEADGTYYLALEYIEGPTLGARLQSGPIPVAELLDLAAQAADALAEAHSRGVLHRDIKPDNLMIDRRGQLKVLDFGLGRMESSAVPENSATRTQALTNPGVVMGTPRYMSPEQALGRPLDGRSDLFSLGVVLYQMATGTSPFHGQTTPEVTNAIINHAPMPPVRVNPQVPVELERIVLRAIEKDPGLRYQSAADLRADLKRLKRDTESGQQAATQAVPAASPRRSKRIWMVAAALVAVAAGAFVVLRPKPAPEALPEMVTRPILNSRTAEISPSISPDGKTVAYAWNGEEGGENFDIYVKLIDAGNPLRLTDTPERERRPKWSPDGKYVAFERVKGVQLQLLLVPGLGGPERLLVEQQESAKVRGGFAWHPDGKHIVYATTGETEPIGLILLDLESGVRRRLSTAPPNTYAEGSPVFVAGGTKVVFTRRSGVIGGAIHVLTLQDGSVRTVSPFDSPSDGNIGAPVGDAEVLLASRRRLNINTGARTVTPHLPMSEFSSLSADGRRLVFQQVTSDFNIWHVALDQPGRPGPALSWIDSTAVDHVPVYSPTGDQILFLSDRSGKPAFWLSDRQGRNPQMIAVNGPLTGSPRLSPDAKRLVFDAKDQIYLVSASGGTARQITTDSFENVTPSWSYDGEWVYYCSNRSGRQEIWRIRPSGGASEQVSRGGGFDPIETADGKSLYFLRSREAPALVRRTPDGTEEVLVPELAGRFWTIGPTGIYFGDKQRKRIMYYDLATRKTQPLLTLTGPIVQSNRGISVSPDGKDLLWSQLDSQSSDIMLTENFRP